MTNRTRKRLFNYAMLIATGGILMWMVVLGLMDRLFY
jgi:hypothetical protein